VTSDGFAPGEIDTSRAHPARMYNFRTHKAATAAAMYDQATSALTLRTHAQISRYFDGLELLDPGLVQLPRWRPDAKPPRDASAVLVYGAVARKPPPPTIPRHGKNAGKPGHAPGQVAQT